MKIKMILKNISIIFLLLIMLVNKNVYADAVSLSGVGPAPGPRETDVITQETMIRILLMLAPILILSIICFVYFAKIFLGKNKSEKESKDIIKESNSQESSNEKYVIGIILMFIISFAISMFFISLKNIGIIIGLLCLFTFIFSNLKIKEKMTIRERFKSCLIVTVINVLVAIDYSYVFFVIM